ncbi:cytochrome d ubiquinol oxidase subunit II [Camelimonas abortus]|uniref:Cytochrome d ubiquinol oxidase subunit II n=1 Tax=Camelimonas abortus TaxID=1017184 RepID=A0ABV7LBF5_9HYPH
MILHDLISYEHLRLIWWALLGVLLIGFAWTDGFDLGVGALTPFVGRTDVERRIAINSVAPTWEGNQVWLILGGGAIFAAWPQLYAVSFSGFYLAMFAILMALILRPVGFKYRSKLENPAWRNAWDWALFIGGAVPSLIFGVAVGNVLQGVPFRLDQDMRIFYDGTFFGLLNPFALLCGVLSVCMLVTHGAAWLAVKTDGPVHARARAIGSVTALLTLALFVLAGAWLYHGGVDGYRFASEAARNGASNPHAKEVVRAAGAWFDNYQAAPWTLVAPAAGVIGALLTFIALRLRGEITALLASKLAIFGIISTVGVSMFPFILPSSEDPNVSLTVWDSSSSHLTLFIMLVCTVIFLPVVLAYTAFVYRVLWGKVEEKDITGENSHAY